MNLIHTEIDINAPVERVWQVLTDFASFPQWNPFIRAIKGDLKPGSRMDMTSQFFKSREMNFRSTVLRVEPNRELRWLGHFLLPHIFDGEHYFLLEPLETGRTRLVHDEIFSGLLVPFFSNRLSQETRRGFEEMNRALKARVEKGEPTCPASRDSETAG
jgi:hypothetical protein